MIVKKTQKYAMPMYTQAPFLFAVYHKDLYPKGNERMEAPMRGNGMHFDPSAPFRMYHGSKVPGFPVHPHKGLTTVTCSIEGLIDHADSLGCRGRYGEDGDIQWMSAGNGIQHSEMFPLLNSDSDNPLRFFQLWLNLPASGKRLPASQVLHWHEDVPIFKSPSGKSSVRVWAGKYAGLQALPPTENSWAANPNAKVTILFFKISPGESLKLESVSDDKVNRTLYVTEGDAPLQLSTGEEVALESYATLSVSDQDTLLRNPGSKEMQALYIAGVSINEPVVHHGPFVMNTTEEIQRAFQEYRETRFGGWPWDRDDPVFDRTIGRFLDIKGSERQFPRKQTE